MSQPAYLRRKHAIVTGGGRGIGAAIATELARLGADLTLMGRNRAKLEDHKEKLVKEFGVKILVVECDVSDGDTVTQAFSAASEQLGPVHVLVNNAGQASPAPFAEMPRNLWDRMLAVNLTGTSLCAQQVLPAMMAAKSGRIINIASTAGLKGYSHMTAYCAAKHGVIGLTRALALETAKLGITVNAVCPGYADTDMTKSAIDNLITAMGKTQAEARQMILRIIPRGSLIQPSEVASLVGWLCSPDAAAVTGQAIAVAGGEVL